VGDLASIEAVIDGAVKESGGFDVLVNNAGITKDGLSSA
jgi:3-oxoacyl-[acyl-carrier protein] reductase